MTQRQPGDYVVNAELTDEQRKRFVKDCVAAWAYDFTSDSRGKFTVMTVPEGAEIRCVGLCRDTINNVTHEYKAQPTPQPQLMRQIADAMERNPEGWWREFRLGDHKVRASTKRQFWACVALGVEACLEPKTYTLHVEEMPEPLREEPEYNSEYFIMRFGNGGPFRTKWAGTKDDFRRLRHGLCYPNETTAREALEKLTKAMGGGND